MSRWRRRKGDIKPGAVKRGCNPRGETGTQRRKLLIFLLILFLIVILIVILIGAGNAASPPRRRGAETRSRVAADDADCADHRRLNSFRCSVASCDLYCWRCI